MGTLLVQLRKDNMAAMKAKDTLKKGVLSLVISAIALKEKESGITLDEASEQEIIQKELKQTKDALAQTPENREDLIAENKAKIAILESYLPKQMSEDEIRDAINKIISEDGLELTKKSQGPIMKKMMAQYKGLIDGKLVNKVLGEVLNG